MEKEFVPYELALKVKHLGFDELCFAYYDVIKVELDTISSEVCERLCKHNTHIKAPTFSQAFRWFRENHNLHAEPYTVDMGAIEYSFQIRDLYSEKYIYDNFVGAGGSYHGTFDTPEEAELKCLEKLIDIVSQQNIK
jgi:hypothetical protein